MSEEETELSKSTAWIITAIAIIVAAAPHAFFAPPLQLHMEGQMQAWLGIAVWAPAILAGVAFFFGVEFGARDEERTSAIDPNLRATALIGATIAYLVFAAGLHADRWTGMAGMRPWDELSTLLPLFALLGALRGLFFQGFVQDRVMSDSPSGGRVAMVIVLELMIVAPFLVSADAATIAAGLMPLVAAEALLGAISFEVGYPVRIAMLVRAIAGVAFIWFQQVTLL